MEILIALAIFTTIIIYARSGSSHSDKLYKPRSEEQPWERSIREEREWNRKLERQKLIQIGRENTPREVWLKAFPEACPSCLSLARKDREETLPGPNGWNGKRTETCCVECGRVLREKQSECCSSCGAYESLVRSEKEVWEDTTGPPDYYASSGYVKHTYTECKCCNNCVQVS